MENHSRQYRQLCSVFFFTLFCYSRNKMRIPIGKGMRREGRLFFCSLKYTERKEKIKKKVAILGNIFHVSMDTKSTLSQFYPPSYNFSTPNRLDRKRCTFSNFFFSFLIFTSLFFPRTIFFLFFLFFLNRL